MERSDVGQGIRVASFFTGAGGLDLGFDLAGFDVAYATDIDGTSCDTLGANLGGLLSKGTLIERSDIKEIDPATLPPDIDVVIGGPPCQSFSASARRAGGAAGRLDARGTLFEAYCRVIAHVKPRTFLFENVRGILGTNEGRDWAVIVAAFEKIGYGISYRLLDALDYGAPQQRERMIMVGHKLDHDFLFPRPLFGPDSATGQPHIAAGEALEGVTEDEDEDSLALKDGKYAHLLPLVPPGENYLFFTAKRGHPKPIFAYRSRFSDFLYKADPKLPVRTLIASPGKYTGPFHWENRRFTVREYMRLQGFPDDYQLVGNRAERIRQIGNSVSPKLSSMLALAIAKQVFGRTAHVELMQEDFALSFDRRKGRKAVTTRKKHAEVAARTTRSSFNLVNYTSTVVPSQLNGTPNVEVVTESGTAKVTVRSDASSKVFAKAVLEIFDSEDKIHSAGKPPVTLDVTAYGISEHTIQTMWNAIDDWVIKSSNFHSLFELYGNAE